MEFENDNTISEEALYAKYTIQLYDALTSGKGLLGILNAAEKIFNNPILVADHSFKVIAHIEHPNIDNDLWRKITSNGYYPADYLKIITSNKEIYHHVFSSNAPEILSDTGSQNRYFCKMIVVNGKPIGFSTCVEHERAFTLLDARLFEVLCKVVAAELRCHDIVRQYHSNPYGYFISEMLSGSVNADFLEERMKQVGLNLKHHLFVLVAEFEDEKMHLDHLMEYYRSTLEQVVSVGHCIVFRNSLVILISLDQKMLVTELFRNKVSEKLKAFHMIGGVSYRFHRIEEISIYYKQACKAIQIGRRMDKNGRLFDYEDMYFYHMLDMNRQPEDVKRFCNPKLLDIIEYDNEFNTCYATTAFTFLSTSMSSALTAKLMNVHRNSIDYRIKRMEELFDLNFNNRELTFSLDLSFRILRFLSIPPFHTG